jgi:hypothetical protein
MSRAITLTTNMTDKGLTIQALGKLRLEYEEMGGSSLRITSGPLANATIDLTTGKMTGDSDHGHHKDAFLKLQDRYLEAETRRAYARQGIQIQRSYEKDGAIIMEAMKVFS